MSPRSVDASCSERAFATSLTNSPPSRIGPPVAHTFPVCSFATHPSRVCVAAVVSCCSAGEQHDPWRGIDERIDQSKRHVTVGQATVAMTPSALGPSGRALYPTIRFLRRSTTPSHRISRRRISTTFSLHGHYKASASRARRRERTHMGAEGQTCAKNTGSCSGASGRSTTECTFCDHGP